MTTKNDAMMPQLKALKTTDLTPLIRMAGVMMPRVLNAFLKNLDEKEKSAFDKVMPVGGEKKMYVHLTDTPTPPIVIGLSQPPKMSTLSANEVKQQQIRGIRLTTGDLQILTGGMTLGVMLKLLWRLKGQLFTLLGMMSLFGPFLQLGPSGLRRLGNKMTTQFKPLIDMLPRK